MKVSGIVTREENPSVSRVSETPKSSRSIECVESAVLSDNESNCALGVSLIKLQDVCADVLDSTNFMVYYEQAQVLHKGQKTRNKEVFNSPLHAPNNLESEVPGSETNNNGCTSSSSPVKGIQE